MGKRSTTAKNFWVVHARNILPWDLGKIWSCNINYKDIPDLVNNSIWTHIWTARAKYSYFKPRKNEEVLDQILWYNSHIKCQRKVLHHEWLSADAITTVRDLINEQGSAFMTYDELVQKYNYHIILVLCDIIPLRLQFPIHGSISSLWKTVNREIGTIGNGKRFKLLSRFPNMYTMN